MAGIIAVAILLALVLMGGLVAYRRTIGQGQYSGNMRGAVGVGSLLGIFLGLAAGFATLLLVLLLRAAK